MSWINPPRPLRPLLTLAAVFALAACATTPKHTDAGAGAATSNPSALTPFDQYRAVSGPAQDKVALAPHPGGVLSDAQKLALNELARRLDEANGAKVTLAIASGETAGSPADLTRRASAAYLVSLGVAPEKLELGLYAASPDSNPVAISFKTFQATGPDCSKGMADYASTGSNAVNSHFGCADAANLAALVSDPRDLTRPAPEQPADAARRAVVLDKYRKGESTSSTKDSQASGSISTAVQ